jgi:mono/diheme cytochrome c family protein
MPTTEQSRRIRLLILLAILVCGGVVLMHAALDWTAMAKARKLKNPVPATPAAVDAGMQLYTNHCRSCHGKNGDGKGEKASELSVAPGDFTDARKMDATTDGELYWQITKGRMPMPAFQRKLTDNERWELVDYIRTFAAATQTNAPQKP